MKQAHPDQLHRGHREPQSSGRPVRLFGNLHAHESFYSATDHTDKTDYTDNTRPANAFIRAIRSIRAIRGSKREIPSRVISWSLAGLPDLCGSLCSLCNFPSPSHFGTAALSSRLFPKNPFPSVPSLTYLLFLSFYPTTTTNHTKTTN